MKTMWKRLLLTAMVSAALSTPVLAADMTVGFSAGYHKIAYCFMNNSITILYAAVVIASSPFKSNQFCLLQLFAPSDIKTQLFYP
ncbi:hypothetical protein CRX72_16655 [Pantoea sp. BRM17]|nr:hypothetical protein CRX72_16655 [Pantoea sp. BRM17]